MADFPARLLLAAILLVSAANGRHFEATAADLTHGAPMDDVESIHPLLRALLRHSPVFNMADVLVRLHLAAIQLVGAAKSHRYEGRACAEGGTCIPLRNCQAAKEGLRKGYFPHTCLFYGAELFVCCMPAPDATLAPNRAKSAFSSDRPDPNHGRAASTPSQTDPTPSRAEPAPSPSRPDLIHSRAASSPSQADPTPSRTDLTPSRNDPSSGQNDSILIRTDSTTSLANPTSETNRVITTLDVSRIDRTLTHGTIDTISNSKRTNITLGGSPIDPIFSLNRAVPTLHIDRTDSNIPSGIGSTFSSETNSTLPSGIGSTIPSGSDSAVSSGADSTVTSGEADTTFPSGTNSIPSSGIDSTILSGSDSTVSSGADSTVTSSGADSTFSSGINSTLPSGTDSTIPSGSDSAASSGANSTITSSGANSIFPSGTNSTLTNEIYSSISSGLLSKLNSIITSSGADTVTSSWAEPSSDPEQVSRCPSLPEKAVKVQKTGQKAWDKCIELAQYAYPCVPSDPSNSTMVREETCHQVTAPRRPNNRRLVVGGTPAKEGEFPHMALLGFGELLLVRWVCGGSLVSERWVLTAGHCTFDRNTKEDVKHVRLGGEPSDSPLDMRNYYSVVSIAMEPDYRLNSVYNDIALLQLDRTVTFTTLIHPACLHTGEPVNDEKIIATGWGTTKDGGEMNSELLKVVLDKFSYIDCALKNPAFRKSKEGIRDATQLCAGHWTESKDTCQGDSGGPIQLFNSDRVFCTYLVVGVTSYGKTCGVLGQPAPYTRVSAFIPWIESVVWP